MPLLVYAVGVAIGLWRVDAAPLTRTLVALLWPLGIVAAVVTLTGLALTAMVLFPIVGIATVIGLALLWWLVT